ncbi:hypothetical protein MMC29_002731 [Sticta canariensis]|nr:hypothetical protein [Sticta canariensis]
MRPFPDLDTTSNSVLGWKQLSERLTAYKHHKLLQRSSERFERLRNIIRTKFFFDHLLITIEPENPKTVLATKLKDRNLPDQRKKGYLQLPGHGIFTADELLFGEFGEPKNSLAPGSSTESNAEFAAAFNRSQAEIAQSAARLRGFTGFFQRWQFKKDTNYVHNFLDKYVARRLESRKFQDTKETTDERYIFLHELVKETQHALQIRSELLKFLLDGRDTTASLLSNVWFVRARRPDVWVKLCAEVEQLGGESPHTSNSKE